MWFQGEKTFALHLFETAQDFLDMTVSCAHRNHAAIRHFSVLYVHIEDIGLEHLIGLQRLNAALDEVCRIEHPGKPPLKMPVKVKAAFRRVAVDFLFVFMAAQHMMFKRVIRHPADTREDLVPVGFVALVLFKIKAEYTNQAAAEDFGNLNRIFKRLKMRLKIIRNIDLAVRRADCGDLCALRIELCLEHPGVVCR